MKNDSQRCWWLQPERLRRMETDHRALGILLVPCILSSRGQTCSRNPIYLARCLYVKFLLHRHLFTYSSFYLFLSLGFHGVDLELVAYYWWAKGSGWPSLSINTFMHMMVNLYCQFNGIYDHQGVTLLRVSMRAFPERSKWERKTRLQCGQNQSTGWGSRLR